MGFKKRVDGNQVAVVTALRGNTNVTVSHTHGVGNGFPDVVVGVRNGLTLVGTFSKKKVVKLLSSVEGLYVIDRANLLMEIKDEAQPASKRKLTPPEEKWHAEWGGQVSIVESPAAAISLVSKGTT